MAGEEVKKDDNWSDEDDEESDFRDSDSQSSSGSDSVSTSKSKSSKKKKKVASSNKKRLERLEAQRLTYAKNVKPISLKEISNMIHSKSGLTMYDIVGGEHVIT